MTDTTRPKRFSARPTLYKGVQMRSRLEAGFAQWCDQSGIPWEYEPHALADGEGQWLPDFRISAVWLYGSGFELRPTYVEVKPKGWISKPDAARLASHWKRLSDTVGDFTAMLLATPDGLFMPPWDESDEDGFVKLLAVSTADDFSGLSDPTNQRTIDIQAKPVNTWFLELFWSEPTQPWQGEWWKH